MKKLLRITLSVLLLLAGTAPLFAQEKQFIRYITRQTQQGRWITPRVQAKLSEFHYVPPRTALEARRQASHYTLEDEVVELPNGAVALSNGKDTQKGKHSLVPSAVTILGSDAFITPQNRQISQLRQQARAETVREYLTPAERAVWAE